MVSSTIEITIGAELRLRYLTPDAEVAVIRANSFPNPEHARRVRLGLWAGDVDRVIELWRRSDAGGLIVPRGTFPLVVKICRERGLPFRVEDRTIAPPLNLDLTPGDLFPDQQKALDELLKYPTGILEGPTGCGKTNVLLSTIARLKTTALIVVHTTELFQQTRARCRSWIGVEPGALGAGQWDLRPVSVAMVQTLARRDLDGIAEYFGCLLLDEVHHAPARTWAEVCRQFPTRFLYGFTATAWRKDRLEGIMRRTIGPISAKISAAEVVAAGRIITPTIETVDTDFFYELDDPLAWGPMLTALIQDEDRNALIVEELRARLTPETRALILSDRIDHVYDLAGRLDDLDPVVLVGEMSKSGREEAMQAVRAGAPLTIATTSLLGEGVDVPCWDLLVLASPMGRSPRVLQAIGRVSRAAPGKARAVVVDFVDARVPALMAAHRQRARLYDEVAA